MIGPIQKLAQEAMDMVAKISWCRSADLQVVFHSSTHVPRWTPRRQLAPVFGQARDFALTPKPVRSTACQLTGAMYIIVVG